MLNQNAIQAPTKADMYSLYIPGGFTCNLLGETVMGDTNPRMYIGQDSSTAANDGEFVILPTGMTGPGRWIQAKGQ